VSIAIRLFIVLSRRFRPAIIFSRPRGSPAVPFAASPIRLATLRRACPWARSPPSVSTYVLSAVLAAADELRDEDSCRAFALHAFAQQREHFLRAFRIEVSGSARRRTPGAACAPGRARSRRAASRRLKSSLRHGFRRARPASPTRAARRPACAWACSRIAVQREREAGDVLLPPSGKAGCGTPGTTKPMCLRRIRVRASSSSAHRSTPSRSTLPGIGPFQPGDEVEQRGFSESPIRPSPRRSRPRRASKPMSRRTVFARRTGKGLAEVPDRQHSGEVTCAQACSKRAVTRPD